MDTTDTTPLSSSTQPVVYPESDGKPMAETDVHRQEMMDTIATLSDFFRDNPNVYVAGNLLLYYEEGNPQAVVAPDVFVVVGVPKRLRRVYKLWEESHPPTFVIELTSRSTRLEDLGNKRALYAMLGVPEYFLFDPLSEYLTPPLQGFQLANGDYQRLDPDASGAFSSQALGLRLQVEHGRLRLIDATTGERLLRPSEVAEARRIAEQQVQTEIAARRAVEQRLTTVEQEVARLREELLRLQGRSTAEDG